MATVSFGKRFGHVGENKSPKSGLIAALRNLGRRRGAGAARADVRPIGYISANAPGDLGRLVR